MKLNRKWFLVIALVLSMTMAISGTLAYLSDTATDVNVMTLGSVHIEQHEYERALNEDGTYKTATIDNQTSYVLQDYTQGKPLLPIVGSPASESGYAAAGWDETTVRMSQVDSYGGMQVFAGKNAVDKFVTVENTGKSDAYVRTIVAIEAGSTDGSLIGSSYHTNWSQSENPIYIEIGGTRYMVIEYNYNGAQLSDGTWRHKNGILPAGETSYPNLSQVYVKSAAGNEDLEAIDGNENGMLDILVLSQAIQADGFADAATALNAGFGEVNAENIAKWFDAPVAKVTVLKPTDTITNADGDVTVLGENLTIDTTGSKMGIDMGKFSLDTAYQFEPTMSTEEVKESEYKTWHADFVVSSNKDIPAYGIGLAGYYDAWCSFNDDKWVLLTADTKISANEEIRLVDAMGSGSITVSYKDLCDYGNDGIGFLCGAIDLGGKTIGNKTIEELADGTSLTVKLRLYEATDGSRSSETGNYITVCTKTYTF